MKRLVIFITISLLLMGFVAAAITTGAIKNLTQTQSGLASEDNESENTASLTATNTEAAKERIRATIMAGRRAFCGKSTFGECQTDADCITAGCSNSVCQGVNEEQIITTCEWTECYNSETYNLNCLCINNKCIWSKLTNAQIKKIITARNRIRVTAQIGECPTGCTCTGSVVKCELASGREMTVIAGKSGNVIVQVKGVHASTDVTLYKAEDGKLYGVFRNNETKVVRMLPDQVKERIRERTGAMLQNETISLNENGSYEYQAEKRARLFFIFPVRMMVRAEIDAETGEVVKVSKPKWWAFLARDEEQFVLGESCGTVTPGENDNCCKNKGYDVWDAETQQCDFAE